MSKAACDVCGGKGRVPTDGGRYLSQCLPCAGTGRKKYKTRTCPACRGAGYSQGACVECGGSGQLFDESA